MSEESPNTHPIPDYDGLWDTLTEKQKNFVLNILQGMPKVDAYINAYDVSETTDRRVSAVSATRESKKPKIALIIGSMREKQGDFSRAMHDEALVRIAHKSEIEGKYGAAITAYQTLGKAAGLYVDQIADVTNKDPQETLQEIAQSAPELAEAIAQQMGLPSPTKH